MQHLLEDILQLICSSSKHLAVIRSRFILPSYTKIGVVITQVDTQNRLLLINKNVRIISYLRSKDVQA